ncbi:hypothetical protein KAT95_01545 [Candidatus Parcubacteria bacterium]|nr:hypothetical protein [Candidatus Parcubacteria bacterium]
MEKRFCDECGEEIDENYKTIESKGKERDFGLDLTFGKPADFCNWRCLIAWAEEKRISAVIQEERTEMGKKKKILYSWEGKDILSNDIEKKNGELRLTQGAYERLK